MCRPRWRPPLPAGRGRAAWTDAGCSAGSCRSYPAWRVKVNGNPIHALPQRDDGLMAVPVPQGRLDVTVDWATTPDVLVGRSLTCLSLLLLTWLGLVKRRLSRPRLS